MAYVDPVKKTESEIEELIRLQAQDRPGGEGQTDGGDTSTGAPADGAAFAVREPAVSQQPTSGPDEDSYRHRWETLQGKYAAETRRANEQIRQLQSEVAALKEQVVKPPEQKPTNVEEAIDELQREYGEQFTNALDRRIDRKIEASVDRKIAEKIKPVEDKVNQVSTDNQANAAGAYFTQLSRLCPDWEKQNVDKGFLQWLVTTRAGRYTMQQVLTDAHNAQDAAAVADVFHAYRRVQPPARNQPQPNKGPTRPDPNALLVPKGRGSGDGATIDDSQGQVVTMSEVDKFYREMEMGKVDPKEAARREAEIMKAAQEGRIVG
jgi:hypothetical protein